MAATTLNPYIFFNGDCAEAMDFYKNAFGGELTMQKYSEVPGDMPGKAEHPDWVMHSALEGGLVKIMGCDSDKASPKAAKIELSIIGSDEDALRKTFDALSEGGSVKEPLKKQFWGDTFGQLTDKYNIDWMVNVLAPKAQSS